MEKRVWVHFTDKNFTDDPFLRIPFHRRKISPAENFTEWKFHRQWKISPTMKNITEWKFYSRVILWGIGQNWTRVHQNPWNLTIWFFIHKTRIFLFWPKKIFLSVFWIFEKFWSCATKNRKITLLAVNNALFNRFSWLSTFFEGNLVIFWFLLHFENFCKFSFWALTLETKLIETL
jgi:hypothetical protein